MLRYRKCITRIGFILLISLVSSLPALAQSPVILTGGTVNAADYSRSFAPCGLISIFGSNLSSSVQQPAAFPLPTTLAGTSVQLVSTSALLPLWYVSPRQINAQLPCALPVGQYQVQVRTAAGTSGSDAITVAARAPRIFALDASGQGTAVGTTTDYRILTGGNPADPGEVIIVWMNSLGVTSGNPVEGQPAPGVAPGSQPSVVNAAVTATINGADAPVSFAGLSPGSAGLYQVNIRSPFLVVTGPVDVSVTVEGVTSQAQITLPYRQLGFYAALMGGKAVTGQTLNGVSGATSALAFRQSDTLTWGTEGLNAWSKKTGLDATASGVTGVALTLRNGSTVVYDNNGVEGKSTGTFYDNTNGGPDTQKPGLSDLFSMSNYFPMVFSGYFRLAAATQITELIGYFDALSNLDIPFDPANPYVSYRMNIWSNTTSNAPRETNNFTGDVFSSATAAGKFTFSDSGVKIVSRDPKLDPKSVYRLSYVLTQPLTLPAGEYWFAHDASVLAQPAARAPIQVTQTEFRQMREQIDALRTYQVEPARMSIFGREMSVRDSFILPNAMTVRPSAPIMH